MNGAIIIEGHVQGLANTRALGKEGIPIYIIDTGNCISRYSKYCHKFFRCPDYFTDEFATFLIDLAKKENIKNWMLIPSNDHAVYTISKHRREILKYYKTIVPDFDVLIKIIDKSNLFSIAKKCGLQIPKTEYFKELNNIQTKLKFPVLTKGKIGLSFYKATGKKGFSAHNITEFQNQLAYISKEMDLENTFTQEIIPSDGKNKTISFTAFCINGEIKSHWTGVKLMEHPLEFGTATLAQSIKNEVVLKQSEILLKELAYTGVCEVEYLFDPRDEQYKLIEINPRTWLWVGLTIANGINYPHYIYNFLNDINQNYCKDYVEGLKWVNPYTNFVYGIKALAHKKISLANLKKINSGKKISALYEIHDIKPFFAYALLLSKMIKTR